MEGEGVYAEGEEDCVACLGGMLVWCILIFGWRISSRGILFLTYLHRNETRISIIRATIHQARDHEADHKDEIGPSRRNVG